MIKAIIFDFWGTLVENGVWSPIKQVKNILRIDLPFSEYVVRMEKAMMTSKQGSLKECFQKVCAEFSINCDEETIEKLIGMWNKSWMLAQPYEEMEETLTYLKQKYKIILVSNSDCFSVPKVIEKFNLAHLFDKRYYSFELGTIKTEKQFFQHVLNDLQLQIEDCVMVGDSIQSDILAAKKLGMEAILVDRRSTREFNPKVKNLREIENVL